MKIAITVAALLGFACSGHHAPGDGGLDGGVGGRKAGFIPAGPFVPANGKVSGGAGGGTGTVTSVAASTGLTGGTITTSGTIAVDPTTVQTRVSTACGAGTFYAAIAQDGTATCTAEPGDISAVTAGTGLTGGGTSGAVSLAVDPTAVQTRVTTSCSAGQFLTAIAQGGTATCTAEPGDISSVVAGTGLTGGATTGAATLNVDPTVAQTRISTSCGAGQFLTAVAQDGTATCTAEPGDISSVVAGTSLTGGATSGAATLNVSLPGGTCGTGQVVTALSASGTATCSATPAPAMTLAANVWTDEWAGTASSGTIIGSGWVYNFSGAAAAITQAAGDAAHPGINTYSTGTATTGRSSVILGGTGSTAYLFGGGTNTADILMRPATICDSIVDICTIRCGYLDSVTAESTDGAFLKFDPAASANWRTVTISNTTKSEADASPAVAVTAATWYHLGIAVNAAGTSVDFTINGVAEGTVATNVPSGAGRGLGLGCMILKSFGVTARTFDLDYILATNPLTTAR